MTKNNKQKNIHADWQFFSVGNVLDYEQPTPFIVESTEYKKTGTPVLTAGKTFVLGYTDEKKGIYQNLPAIIFDDFTTAIKYVDFPFKVKSSAMKILKNKPVKSNIKFVFGWMQTNKFIVGEHKRNYLSEYQYLDILLPPIEEQDKIVQILEAWDNYLEKLNKKIELKKQIKKGLMQNLLTGKIRLEGFSDDWKSVKLGNICKFKKGEQLNKSNMIKGVLYPVINGGVEPSGFTNKWNYEENNITISEGGNSCGFVNFITSKFWSGGHCYVVDSKENDKIFIYYLLKKKERKIMSLRVGSGLPNIQKKSLDILKIKIPALEEQQTIANILSSADKEIESLEKKKKIVEAQKKFLLNNLISGKIRHPEFIKNN